MEIFVGNLLVLFERKLEFYSNKIRKEKKTAIRKQI